MSVLTGITIFLNNHGVIKSPNIGQSSNSMRLFSLDDSPLLGQRYTNPMCFVQRCNFAMYFIQPFQCPHSPWS